MRSDVPETVDLFHFDQPGAIGAHLFDGVIVDPGAEKTVDRVLAALGDEIPQAILLTHIHFDHAGATGRLVEKFPEVEVWVHEAGARHMIDPERLVSSARQVFGEYFDVMWGEVVPVPEQNIRILKGGGGVVPLGVRSPPPPGRPPAVYRGGAAVGGVARGVAGGREGGRPGFPAAPPAGLPPAALA